MGADLDNTISKISVSTGGVYSAIPEADLQAQRDQNSPASKAGGPQAAPESQSVRVTLSEEALRKAGLLKDDKTQKADKSSASDPTDKETQELKRRDREVRAHEQAHLAAGGTLVRGGANFRYVTGPDGKNYAVSGEVSIDTGAVQNDPQATIRKMRQVAKAALAPAEPSVQDRAVAAAAARSENDARQAVSQEQIDSLKGTESSSSTANPETGPEQNKSASPETSKSQPAVSSQLFTPKETTFQAKYINMEA